MKKKSLFIITMMCLAGLLTSLTGIHCYADGEDTIHLGSISVEIENLTTGAYSQATVNATQGVHPFLISGDVGTYEIIFTLSDGRVYFGSFEIE